MSFNDVLKKRRERDQLLYNLGQLISYFAIKSLKRENPNPSYEEIYKSIEQTLDGIKGFSNTKKTLLEIVESIDIKKWHEDPINFVVKMKAVYVKRYEIWETLKSTGLSINKAAQILNKGETFRKWAKTDLSGNEFTPITHDDLELLEFAARDIKMFYELAQQEEIEEEKIRLLKYMESMSIIRHFAIRSRNIFRMHLEKEKELHPERFTTFLGSCLREANKASI